MYSQRVSGRKRSVMDRLSSGGGGGGGSGSGSRPRPDAAKRFLHADGTWRRELYKDSGGIQSSPGLDSRNLQANQKSRMHQSTEVVKKSPVLDLREKLSGVQRPQLNSTVQIPKPIPEIAATAKPVQKRGPPATSALPVTKKVNAPTAPKQSQSQEKADASLDSLLKSLDLQKYSATFEAEEVDMKALVHMNEEDMKSLGIPMGPRKKILSALASKKRKSLRSLPTS